MDLQKMGFGVMNWIELAQDRDRCWTLVNVVMNLKMNIQEVGFGGMDWIELAQDRDRWWTLVNVVMNFWVP